MVVLRWNICYDSGWMVVCGQNGDKNGVGDAGDGR